MNKVSKAAALMGAIGGRNGTGASKALTSAQARAHANIRWAKHRAAMRNKTKTTKTK